MVSEQTFAVCDNISDTHVIGTVEASAPEGQVLTYRLTEDAGGLFEINEDNGNVSLVNNRSLDYTMATQHTIVVLVSNTVAINDTSTANFQINVDTAPLLLSNLTYTFAYQSNVSVRIGSNLGGAIESFNSLTKILPAGLSLSESNAQLFLQGTANQVTIGGPVKEVITVQNACGGNQTVLNITVEPRYVSGNLSPDVVHAGLDASSNNPPEQIYLATNIPFASGGTGAHDDPILIYVKEGATNLSFVVDFAVRIPVDNFDTLPEVHQYLFIQFLNLPNKARINAEFEYIDSIVNTVDVLFIMLPRFSLISLINYNLNDPFGLTIDGSDFTIPEPLELATQGRSSGNRQQLLGGQFRITLRDIAAP